MIAVIIAAVLILLGIGVLIVGPTTYEGTRLRGLGVIPLVLAAIVLIFASTTIVEAKNVGVLTTFGKPSDRTLGSGLHWKAPWQNVTEIDGTVHTNEYYGEDCITGKIGDGSSACLYTTIRWRINPEKAYQVYADYRSDDPAEEFRKAVVSTQFKAAVQTVLAGFNPVANLKVVADPTDTSELSFVPDVDAMAAQLEDQMTERLGKEDLAEVTAITVSGVKISDSTQATIDEFTAEVGKTRVAAQGKATAREQADANEILSDSVSNDPNVLVARCLDLLESGKFTPPAGFSCWPGGSGGIVIPSTR